jgi:hypothetical protein
MTDGAQQFCFFPWISAQRIREGRHPFKFHLWPVDSTCTIIHSGILAGSNLLGNAPEMDEVKHGGLHGRARARGCQGPVAAS